MSYIVTVFTVTYINKYSASFALIVCTGTQLVSSACEKEKCQWQATLTYQSDGKKCTATSKNYNLQNM